MAELINCSLDANEKLGLRERGVCIAGNNEEDEGEDELEREKREKRRRRGEKRTSEDGYSPPEWTKVRIHRPSGVPLIYTSYSLLLHVYIIHCKDTMVCI